MSRATESLAARGLMPLSSIELQSGTMDSGGLLIGTIALQIVKLYICLSTGGQPRTLTRPWV